MDMSDLEVKDDVSAQGANTRGISTPRTGLAIVTSPGKIAFLESYWRMNERQWQRQNHTMALAMSSGMDPSEMLAMARDLALM